jgi:hypothetical protein
MRTPFKPVAGIISTANASPLTNVLEDEIPSMTYY